MQRHLNLIKTDFKETEKRILPRFPYTYLTFKGAQENHKVFEIKDISMSGMQLCLKDGGHQYLPAKEIIGQIRWHGGIVSIIGKVQWVNGQRLGVEFSSDDATTNGLMEFLSYKNFAKNIKALHKTDLELDLPRNLKYWLRADGPVEIFIWMHTDGELSRFQIILLQQFVEWEDGKGLVTGRVLTKRDVETPLVASDEFVFQLDAHPNRERIDLAKLFISYLDNQSIDNAAREFLQVKLG